MSRVIHHTQFDFFATHRLFNENLTDQENVTMYGPCSYPNGHGHNFTLQIAFSFSGLEQDALCGAGTVNNVVAAYIEQNLHMQTLNNYLADEGCQLPSCENVLFKVCKDLGPLLAGKGLIITGLQLKETRNNHVEISL